MFISEKEASNHYLLYLIHRSNQILSPKFMILPTNSILTSRIAIIASICVNQNLDSSHNKLIHYFFDNEPALSTKLKTDYLKLVHFSLINVPKAHLFTNIIKYIPSVKLDIESDF